MGIDYVYILLDPRKPGNFKYPELGISLLYSPFYVGKGKKDRCEHHFKKESLLNKNSHKNNTIRCIKKELNKDPFITIYKKDLLTSNALKEEKRVIKIIGRALLNTGPLTNITPGGEGNNTWLNNPNASEMKKKLSERFKGSGNPMFGTHRFGKENPFFGKTHSKETKLLISDINKKKIMPLEAIEKIRRYLKGRKKTEEHKAKISIAHKGKKKSAQAVEKLSHRNEKYFLYKIINPEGVVITINNLNKFCRENKLCQTNMHRVVSGKQKQYKRWTGKILSSKKDSINV